MELSSTTAWLERLVSHETVSRDSNLALIHEVAAFLAEKGAQVELIHNEDQRKANCLNSPWSGTGGRHSTLWAYGCCSGRWTVMVYRSL